MITIHKIELQIQSPECITCAIARGIEISNQYKCLVSFPFRGVMVRIQPNDKSQDVYDEYSKQYDAMDSLRPDTYEEKHKEGV